jgi:Flp pilus assembly protein TadG
MRTVPQPGLARQGPRGGRGQAAMEFALAVSVMLLLLVGGVDLARVFVYDVMITTAVDEGARAAANGAPDRTVVTNPVGTPTVVVGVKDAAAASAPAGIVPVADVTVTPAQAARLEGTPTTVSMRYVFTPVTPLLGNVIGDSLTISRQATQRIRVACTTDGVTPCP